MFTTGFKFFFGLAMALAAAAIAYGYSTGGEHVGPLTLGWKGGVGEHVGYLVLIGLGLASAGLGGLLVAMRDADPAAQAHYLGVETLAPAASTTGSMWPVAGAFGAATMTIGLVVHSAVFVLGLVIVSLVALEWTMDAWADRATGDPDANRSLRDRIMAPIEIPLAGVAIVGVFVLAVSRILLNASVNGALVWATLIAVVIFGLGTLMANRPHISRNLLAGLALTAGVAVLAGGIVAAVDGTREFHHHEVDHETPTHSETGE
jgi:hypothetical protein